MKIFKWFTLLYYELVAALSTLVSTLSVFRGLDMRGLMPFVLLILLIAIVLIIISSSSVLAPFIYPLF